RSEWRLKRICMKRRTSPRGPRGMGAPLGYAAAILWTMRLSLSAQTPPDPVDLLQKAHGFWTTRSLMANHSSFQIDGNIGAASERSGAQHTDIPVSIAYRKPNQFRWEIRHAVMGFLMVTDGRDTYTYLQAYNQYTKKASSTGSDAFSRFEALLMMLGV